MGRRDRGKRERMNGREGVWRKSKGDEVRNKGGVIGERILSERKT